jgi:hypothetical protein
VVVEVVWLDETGYERVRDFEPPKLYRWDRCGVLVGGNVVEANVLVSKGRSGLTEPTHRAWSSSQDPLLLHGPMVVRELVQDLIVAAPGSLSMGPTQDSEFWRSLMRVEAAYLLLWSVLERYATLRYGPALDPEERIVKLGRDPVFMNCAAEAGVPEGLVVRDTRDLRPVRTGTDGEDVAKYLRQFRHNITHRGKAAYQEARRTVQALMYCFNVTCLLLARSAPGISEEWAVVRPESGLPPLSSFEIEQIMAAESR